MCSPAISLKGPLLTASSTSLSCWTRSRLVSIPAVLQSALQQVIEADDTERLAAIDLDVVAEHIFALRLTKIPLSIGLSTTLASLNNLTSLQIELGHAGISGDEATALGKVLPSIECLTSLSMTNCCLSDDCIQAMKDGMKSNTGPSSSPCLPPGLIALDVSDNKLTAGGLGILFDMMASSVKDDDNKGIASCRALLRRIIASARRVVDFWPRTSCRRLLLSHFSTSS